MPAWLIAFLMSPAGQAVIKAALQALIELFKGVSDKEAAQLGDKAGIFAKSLKERYNDTKSA